MTAAKYVIGVFVVSVGLFGDVAIGTFIGVCVALFYLFMGDAPRVRKSRYEREMPPKNQPYNPNDYEK